MVIAINIDITDNHAYMRVVKEGEKGERDEAGFRHETGCVVVLFAALIPVAGTMKPSLLPLKSAS